MVTAIIVLSIMCGLGIIRLALKMSWGILKLACGLLAFVCLPIMIISAILGAILKALPLVLVGIVFYVLFRKA